MEMDPPSHRAVKLLVGSGRGMDIGSGGKSPCACVCASTGRERLAGLREAKTGAEQASERLKRNSGERKREIATAPSTTRSASSLATCHPLCSAFPLHLAPPR